jgi:hypothetical protein
VVAGHDRDGTPGTGQKREGNVERGAVTIVSHIAQDEDRVDTVSSEAVKRAGDALWHTVEIERTVPRRSGTHVGSEVQIAEHAKPDH